MKRLLFLLLLLVPWLLKAQHVVNIGAGWGDMGMTPTTSWKPYSWSQGSRKEAQSFASYKYVVGNLTPSKGVRGDKSGVRMWIDPDRQFGNQYYPICDTYEPNDGKYLFLHYSVPVEFRVWKMVTEKSGVGFFVGSDIAIIEKDFTHTNAPLAMGYNIYAGFSLMLY